MAPIQDALDYTAGRGTIGVAMHRFTGVVSGTDSKIFTGIQAECNAMRFDLLLKFFRRSREFRAMITPFSLQVDGLIVCGVLHSDLNGDLARLNREVLPVVTCFNSPVHREIPNIGADQVGLGRMATEHLFDGGCRRIVLLPGQGEEARAVGFRQAHRVAGIEMDPELVVNMDDHPEELIADDEAEQAITQLIERKIEFDGIFAQSDILAMGAMRALDKAGIKIPQQVQVIGVDNLPMCYFSPKKLTSITIPSRYRTAFAVRAVVDLLKGRKVDSLSCGPRIFKRETTLADVANANSGVYADSPSRGPSSD